MTATQSPIQMVRTTTVTPAMREVRRALKYAGVLSLVVAVWLGVGLSFCSVNPELSTQADHLLGSVTHIICSWLLNAFGLMSFSVVLLIARFGRLLCAALKPQVAWSDIAVYLLFLVLSATQLQLALNTTMFGAPIGGMIGVWLTTLMTPLGAMIAQGLTCVGLFGVFFTHSFVLQKNTSKEKADEEVLNQWQSEVHLEARPVKSMSSQQQRAHTHVFEQVTEQPPEFDEDAKRFEAVESFYDDLAGSSNPALNHVEDHQDSIFKFDFEEGDEPSLTFDGTSGARSSSDPRLTHESSSYHVHPDDVANSRRAKRVAHSVDARASRRSSGAHASPVDDISQDTSPHNASNRQHTTVSRSPIEKLSQEISPKIAREMILQRGFDAQDLTLALIDTRSGASIEHYFFSSPIAPLKPIYEVAECLNMHIRRALGRTEPPVLLTHKLEHGKHLIEVSWPKRSRVLTDTQEAVQVIRSLEAQQSLNLYLGEAANGEKALLPFKSLKSVLITGGKKVDQEVGLDLLLMNLIHQSLPSALRLIILDQEDHHATISQLPHLYCPVVNTSEQISDVLNWLPSEYRRRRSLMARLSLQSFEKLQERQPQETRIVCVIPKLSQLSIDQQTMLTSVLDKISHSNYHVGIHLIINNRQPITEKIKQSLKTIDVHLGFSAQNIEEANQISSPGAEWLLPQNDLLLTMRGHSPQRVSTWLLSRVSYNRILSVLANGKPIHYINPEANFKRVIPLSRTPQTRETGARKAHSGAQASSSVSPMAALSGVPSESSIPPV